MIRTTVVGSWPPEKRFLPALGAYFRGEMSATAAEPLLRETAAIAIEQQKACGLDQYTGGETSADSFILHFPRVLSGIEATEEHDAWGGRGKYRIVGEIDAPHGLGIAAAFRREKAIDAQLSKVTIPGPSEILMMLGPADARKAAWPQAIELIRTEIADCIADGAADVQLDLPHVAMGTADNWWEGDPAAMVAAIFDNVSAVRRSVHLCYGDFQAKSWTKNRRFAPLLALIQALDGVVDRLVLEFSLPEQWAERHLLAEIPDSMEVAVGIVDVKAPTVETADEIEAKIGALLQILPAQRLLICPSCGLGRRTVPLAMGKTTAMVHAVKRVNNARR